ncbi:MAG: sugar phosphate isomerase/epimerase [Lachnospiraceae bacterium]|nr:sugar phosphate isomerase/epimerase [Lachnospiraceae bacterium]
MEILVSTGALIGRPNGRNPRLLEDIVKKLDGDGLEFMMYSTWYESVDEITEYVNSLGLHIPVYHCQKTVGEEATKGDFAEANRRMEINARQAAAIGAGKLVFHLWNGEISDSAFENNLKAYGDLRKIAADQGVDLLVENVVCNREDPLLHWKQIADRYDTPHFIFDTKMAAFHDQMDAYCTGEYAWAWKEGLVRHYHINDYAGGYKDWTALRTLPIGAGHIDFPKFFSFVRGTGYDGTFTLEATAFDKTGVVDTDMVNRQVAYVRGQMTGSVEK